MSKKMSKKTALRKFNELCIKHNLLNFDITHSVCGFSVTSYYIKEVKPKLSNKEKKIFLYCIKEVNMYILKGLQK